MLIVVLVLVIAALALLVTSLVLGQTLLAWLSIAASVLAAILLIVDVMRRRRAASGEDPAGADDPAETPVDDGAADDALVTERADDDELADVEPGEEETDAADLLAVSELADQVVVLDERPRYHLEDCRWVGARETIPLPIREARDLGFTPCAVCTPDRTLAARARAAKRGKPAG